MHPDAFGRCYVDDFLRERATALLPDPHMGKVFEAGVPLAKRGEREQQVQADLVASLDCPSWVRFHVMVGDLFNRFLVCFEAIYFVARAYKMAADRHPDVTYVIIEGNHDSSRDVARISAFQLFREMVEGVPNIVVVSAYRLVDAQDAGTPSTRVEHLPPLQLNSMALVAWSPFRTAEEVAADLEDPVDCCIGHWDVENTGSNHVPTAILAQVTSRAYTGHEHTPGTMTKNGVEVIRVGAMQPYSHGEDPAGERYITLALPDVEARLSEDPLAFQGKCLRIELRPGEAPPERIDCAQLTRKPLTVEGNEPLPPDQVAGTFDTDTLFRRKLAEKDVSDPVQTALVEHLNLSREESLTFT